ncbi:bifunctional pyr operon transcriptional regulator/uracil phosphoribosyltransferase PyrR [SAR202 cluster bacterium AD-804-J14_MRT_500m]|nr:bifunctional pyr operon transcriptional regulator/uracil phosphoribosyltransferase PyrR [SAR202 cluster bacterium AD-804-J14_MRT_500m]
MSNGRVVMASDDIRRAFSRMAHQVLEQHKGPNDLVFLGIPTRGFPMAHRLVKKINDLEGETPGVGILDISLYRDDVETKRFDRKVPTFLSLNITDKKVIIVDDVLFTGRSARAALDALTDIGRPRLVQLAVLIDRGHRELPIRADFVGKNMPTAMDERVQVRLEEVDGRDEVALFRVKD